MSNFSLIDNQFQITVYKLKQLIGSKLISIFLNIWPYNINDFEYRDETIHIKFEKKDFTIVNATLNFEELEYEEIQADYHYKDLVKRKLLWKEENFLKEYKQEIFDLTNEQKYSTYINSFVENVFLELYKKEYIMSTLIKLDSQRIIQISSNEKDFETSLVHFFENRTFQINKKSKYYSVKDEKILSKSEILKSMN